MLVSKQYFYVALTAHLRRRLHMDCHKATTMVGISSEWLELPGVFSVRTKPFLNSIDFAICS